MDRNDANCSDFEWAFGLNRVMLNLVGIWPNGKDERNFKYLRVPFMVTSIFVGIVLPEMYALSKVSSELPLVVDNVLANCTAITSIFKMLFLWNSREVLGQVVNWAKADYARSRGLWDRQVMTKQARRARIFTIGSYSTMLICSLGIFLPAYFGVSIRIINNITDVGERFLPLQTYYPYNFTASPYYELTFLSQVIISSFVGISYTTIDNFFGALVFHASGQSEILCQMMTRLMSRDDREEYKYEEVERPVVYKMKLRQAIQFHIHLIRYINAVEQSFFMSLLVQVICLSVITCCLGYGVLNGIGSASQRPPLIQILTLGGTLLNLMIHMFVYCFASEILVAHALTLRPALRYMFFLRGLGKSGMNVGRGTLEKKVRELLRGTSSYHSWNHKENEALFHAVYKSNWYSSSSKYSRDTIMIMMKSQYPVRLTAGKFINLSLNAYLNILKTTAGYISMLLTVSSS